MLGPSKIKTLLNSRIIPHSRSTKMRKASKEDKALYKGAMVVGNEVEKERNGYWVCIDFLTNYEKVLVRDLNNLY